MDERLTDEQLQAIRERQAAVKATALKEHEARQALEQDGSAAEKHYALINAEFEWEDARRHAEAFADEDIEALLAHIDALEAERNRLQQAVNEAWDITSKPISSEVEMHPRITQIMDALQDALSKPTLDKYNVKLD